MKALIEAELFRQMHRERIERTRARLAREVDDVTIRRSSKGDAGSLHRLALLDSAPEPQGPMLVAERRGVLVAAVPMRGGRAIADPFEASRDLIGLLELRRCQLQPG